MVLHTRPVRVVNLLREAVESFPPESRKNDVRLKIQHNLDPDIEWTIDARRLMQVVCNLIDNAIKFTIDGGEVKLHADVTPSGLNISVSDTGAGIASDVQDQLFEPFWQADQGDRRGLGLGLPIARSIVEAHSGRMWVESESFYAVECGALAAPSVVRVSRNCQVILPGRALRFACWVKQG
jgi:signal transduction histidine kinase